MKYLDTYKKLGLNNGVTAVFTYFIKTLKDSIFTWDYFVEWKKINTNILNIEKELNILNYLIGKENIEIEFLNLIEEYPNVRKILPILIAIRENKLKNVKVITDLKNLDYEEVHQLFCDDIFPKDEKKLLDFFNKSGLKEIFKDRKVKNLVDYCFGIEVGLDTNARKNRTGKLMELLIENYLERFTNKLNLKYLKQVTSNKLKTEWNLNLEVDKNNRVFDFAIYNTLNNKAFLIEANYYSGGGSKLKATAGEYRDLSNFLKNQEFMFIWITDGIGWRTAKNPLLETFTNNDFIFNLELLENGILTELLLK